MAQIIEVLLLLFLGQKTQILRQFKGDFALAENLVWIIREHEFLFETKEPLAVAIQYILSRQLQSFDGLYLLSKNGNVHAAAIILRVMIEDYLNLSYWQHVPGSEEPWFNKRIEEARKVAERLRIHYLHKPSLLDGIDEYESTIHDLDMLPVNAKWKRQFEQRMVKLAEVLNVKSPATSPNQTLTGLYMYDILYKRYSHFVHPTGLELGRYVELVDDRLRIFLTPSMSLMSEVLYGGMVFLSATYKTYQAIVRNEEAFRTIEPHLDTWDERFQGATFVTVFRNGPTE